MTFTAAGVLGEPFPGFLAHLDLASCYPCHTYLAAIGTGECVAIPNLSGRAGEGASITEAPVLGGGKGVRVIRIPLGVLAVAAEEEKR